MTQQAERIERTKVLVEEIPGSNRQLTRRRAIWPMAAGPIEMVDKAAIDARLAPFNETVRRHLDGLATGPADTPA